MKAVMYHYVRPRDAGLPYFRHLDVDDFDRQLEYFAKTFGIVPRDRFLEAFEAGVAPQGAVLTFDDAVRDHYDEVMPRLIDRGMWGLFYVPTGVYDTHRLLDVHRIHMLLGTLGGVKLLAALRPLIHEGMLAHDKVEAYRNPYGPQVNDEATDEVKRILNYYLSDRDRTALLDTLMAAHWPDEASLASRFYVSGEELSEMQRAGMLLGSHSVSHPVMSKLDPEGQTREIRDSFAFLDRVTGGLTVRSFCYPYGWAHSFTPETERLLTEHGCRFAFSIEHKDIDRDFLTTRPQALPRYNCNQFPFGASPPLPA